MKSGKTIVTIIFLLFLLLGSVIGAIYTLDKMEVFDKEKAIYPKLAKIPGIGKAFSEKQVPYEVAKEEDLRNLKEAIEAKWEELEKKEIKFKEKEEEFNKREKELLAKEDSLLKKRQALEERIAQYEQEERKWAKLAIYYSNMSPDQAAAILENLDDQTIIEIFSRMKDSSVAVTMMKMDKERAAELSRKLVNP
jgi:flagellar motility protein MotE (MotC chaperone)